MAIRPNHNPYRIGSPARAAQDTANDRKFWEQREQEQAMLASQERLFASMHEDSRMPSVASPEETALAWLAMLTTPLFVYVCAGHLSALPWWAYLAIPIVLGILSQRIEAFGEVLVHFGKALIALIAVAALCQTVPLASRAVLAAILALAVCYSIYFTVSNGAERLDRALGRFATCWYAAVVLLIFFIIGCEIAAMWHVDSGTAEVNAIRALKIITGSIYDAGRELWAAISSGRVW